MIVRGESVGVSTGMGCLCFIILNIECGWIIESVPPVVGGQTRS